MAARDQQDVMNDLNLPIALRKKHRATTIAPLVPVDNSKPPHQASATTPKKGKKRVRFSYPPTEPDEDGHAPTGLTPAFKRSKLATPGRPRSPSPSRAFAKSPKSRKASSKAAPKVARRRQTMPATLDNASAAALQSDAPPVTVQFTPIRQILDNRTRRLLARNGLSEVQNTMHAERRLFAKQDRRIRELEAQLAVAQEEARRATAAPQVSASFMRCQQLEAEIQDAHVHLAAESSSSDPMDAGNISDDYVDIQHPSPCPTEEFSDDGGLDEVPPLNLNIDEEPTQADAGVQTDHHHVLPLNLHGDEQAAQAHTGVQTDAHPPEMARFHTQRAKQISFLTRARREVEDILPGETVLPLTPTPDGDASPLIIALLNHLRNAKTELTRTERQVGAITNQQRNLQFNFNNVLEKLRLANTQVHQCHDAIKITNAANDEKRQRIRDLENNNHVLVTDLGQASARITDLKTEIAQNESSINRLNGALNKCYSEIEDYKRIIMTLEKSQAAELEKLKDKHYKAVRDMESEIQHGMAERVELEKSFGPQVEELKSHNTILELQRKEAEYNCKEFRNALYAKQKVVRELEERLKAKQESHEKDIGRLNVRLSETQSRLDEVEGELKSQQKHGVAAVKGFMLAAQSAGEKAVREIIRTSDGQVVGLGLLSPHMDVDFQPGSSAHVQGEIETLRGKAAKKHRRARQRDSGIGDLTEEDEPDEMPIPSNEPSSEI